MKKLVILIIVLSIGFLLAVPSFASIDARAAAMGGAYTAVAQGYSAAYWNPAGITQTKVTAAGASFGVLGSLEDISELNEFINGATISPPEINIAVEGMVGFNTKMLGLSFITKAEAVSDGASFAQGAYRTDMVFTYAGELANFLNLAGISYGINVKSIEVKALYSDWLEKTELTADDMAVDLGAIASVSEIVKIGAVVSDLGASSSWRAGVAIAPPLLDLLVTADLQKGGTFGAGLEKGLGPIAFRFGARNSDDGLAYSAGIGLRGLVVFLDLTYVNDPVYESEFVASASLKF